jgi:predicted cupin superfamily sugar epimerase
MASQIESDAARVIEELNLQPHPEGGFYREIYRSVQQVQAGARRRAASTSIYFLLPAAAHSAWHTVQSDEQWHHYGGAALELHLLREDGHQLMTLGPRILEGELAQAMVPAGVIQAARPIGGWSLMGCTVAPGFDFDDFEMNSAKDLYRRFPSYHRLIDEFL